MQLQVEKAAIRTNVIYMIRESGYTGPINGDRQGFVLSDGRFVPRKVALEVAIKAGQVVRDECHAPSTVLFSEDIW